MFLLEYGKLQLGDLLCRLFELSPLVLGLLSLKPLHLSVLVGLLVEPPIEIHQLLLHEVQGLFELVCLPRRLLVFLGAVFAELSHGLTIVVRVSIHKVPQILGDILKAVQCL